MRTPLVLLLVLLTCTSLLIAPVAAGLEQTYEELRARLDTAKEAYQRDSELSEQLLKAGLELDRLIEIPIRFTLDDALVFDGIQHSVAQLLAAHAYEQLGADYFEFAIKSYRASITMCSPTGINRGIVTRGLMSLLLKDVERNHVAAGMIAATFAEDSTDTATAYDLYQALIGKLVVAKQFAAAAATSARCREDLSGSYSPLCDFLGAISALSTGDRTLAYQLYEEGNARLIKGWSSVEKMRDCSFYSLSTADDFEELLEDPVLERIVTREKIGLNYRVDPSQCSAQEWPFYLKKELDGSYIVADSRREQDQLFCPSDIKEAVLYRIKDATVVGGLIIHEESCTVFSVGAPVMLPRFPSPTLEDQLGRRAFPVTRLEQAVVTTQVGGTDFDFLVSSLPQLMTCLSDMQLTEDAETGEVKSLSQLRAITLTPPVVSMVASASSFHAGWLSPDSGSHLYKVDEVLIVDWAFVEPSNPYRDGLIVENDMATPAHRAPFPSDYALPPQEFLSYTKKIIPTVSSCISTYLSNIVYVRPALFSGGEDAAFVEELELLAEDRGLQLFVLEEDWEVALLGKESPIVPRRGQLGLGPDEPRAEPSPAEDMTFREKASAFSTAAVIISSTTGGAEAGVLFASPYSAVVQFSATFPDAAISGRVAKGCGAEYWLVPSLVVDDVENQVSLGEGAFGDALATVRHILNSKNRRSLCGEEDTN